MFAVFFINTRQRQKKFLRVEQKPNFIVHTLIDVWGMAYPRLDYDGKRYGQQLVQSSGQWGHGVFANYGQTN
jgi:hypothetical protein